MIAIEVKRIVFNENGAVTEIEFYPGTDLANAMDQVMQMNLTSQGNLPRWQGIKEFIEKRNSLSKLTEYPPSPKHDA